MKVCLVNDMFQTSAPSGAYRIQGLAQALRDLGHHTVEVCPFFSVEDGAAYPEAGIYRNPMDSYLRNSAVLLRRLRRIDADVFLVEVPFPWTKVSVAIAKTFVGERAFLDFGEFWIEAAQRMHSWVATEAMRFATTVVPGVSVTTRALRQWMISHFRLPSERVFYLPCGVSSDFFAQGASLHGHEAGDGDSGLVVGYEGTISPAQGCDRLMDIVQEVHRERPSSRFLFVGGGTLLDPLRLRAEQLGLLSSVTFTGRVPREQLAGLVARMDIGLSLKPNRGNLTIGTFPQKLPEYMAVGCVPVSTPLQEAQSIISSGVTGIVSEVETMGDAIVGLLDDREERERMSRSAAEAARKGYVWTRLAEGLVNFWRERSPPSEGDAGPTATRRALGAPGLR